MITAPLTIMGCIEVIIAGFMFGTGFFLANWLWGKIFK